MLHERRERPFGAGSVAEVHRRVLERAMAQAESCLPQLCPLAHEAQQLCSRLEEQKEGQEWDPASQLPISISCVSLNAAKACNACLKVTN